MSLTRVKPPNWTSGDKLTSAELNALDTNVTNALDKRSGQTDTLASNVAVTGNTTFGGASVTTVNGTLDANGTTTLDGATAVNGTLDVNNTTALKGATTVNGSLTVVSGAAFSVDRTVAMAATRNVQFAATGGVTFLPDRTIQRKVPLGAAVLGESVGTADTGFTDPIQPLTSAITSVFRINSLGFGTVDTGSTSRRYWVLDLTPYIADGATVTNVTLTCLGPGGHAALPARTPSIMVARRRGAGVGTTLVMHSAGSVINDPSANVAAYQASHTIVATIDQNNVIDKSQDIVYMIIANEGSTNGIAGFSCQDLTLTFALSALPPAY